MSKESKNIHTILNKITETVVKLNSARTVAEVNSLGKKLEKLGSDLEAADAAYFDAVAKVSRLKDTGRKRLNSVSFMIKSAKKRKQ